MPVFLQILNIFNEELSREEERPTGKRMTMLGTGGGVDFDPNFSSPKRLKPQACSLKSNSA